MCGSAVRPQGADGQGLGRRVMHAVVVVAILRSRERTASAGDGGAREGRRLDPLLPDATSVVGGGAHGRAPRCRKWRSLLAYHCSATDPGLNVGGLVQCARSGDVAMRLSSFFHFF